MKIAVIGAGFTGLSAAWQLIKDGHKVTIFEKEAQPGGLAIGFKQPGWDWALEKHYHHIFQSDKFIQEIANEIGHPFHFYDAKTFTLFEKNNRLEYIRLDSPQTLLSLSKLGLFDRVRMGIVLAYLRYMANWKNLESQTAVSWLSKWVGAPGYKLIWEPLLVGKFGEAAPIVNMAWFWSRIKARSQKLGYFDGGFLGLAQSWLKKIEDAGGIVKMNSNINGVDELSKKFDKVIIAGAPKLVKHKIDYLGSVNLILQMKKSFLPHGIYWLNMNLQRSPMLAIVEHTNMIDKSHYGNENIVYLAKYVPHDHKYFEMADKDILEEYKSVLTKINPNWEKSLKKFTVHRAKFTQPIMPVNYSQYIPDFSTDIPNVLSASMQQVYPWDRGTNFAIELGQKVAKLI